MTTPQDDTSVASDTSDTSDAITAITAIAQAAAALQQSRSTRRSLAPISASYGLQVLEAADALAEINTRARLAEGRRSVGKKVGLTAKAVQQQLGVDQPDFGMLFDDMEYLDGQEVAAVRLIQPKVEAEVAFVMGRDVMGTAPSWAEFLACVACALPAIEIVDSAITAWKIGHVDTVADNASSGLYVLGDQPVAMGTQSLGGIGMTMSKNGKVVAVAVAVGAAGLGHLLRAACWLVRTMAARQHGLRAGEVILSGALGPMLPAAAGALVRADLGALGRVSFRMVGCACTRFTSPT